MDLGELDELNSVELTEEQEVSDSTKQEEGSKDTKLLNEGGESSEPQKNEEGGQEEESQEKVEVEEEVQTAELSGIERYLAQFDIEGGMIQFDDGSKVHFNDLDAEKQQEILSQLHDSNSVEIEDRYGLDEQEIGLINYLRENGVTIDELVDQMAAQRAQTYIMSQQAQNMNIKELDDDAVYTAFLLKSNPEATAEQIEKDLETAKKMSNYESIVKNLRTNFEKEQEAFLQNQQEEERQKLMESIEKDRQEVVAAVEQLNEIDGLSINDGIKNDVLDMILNVDEDGDSLFMTNVFSDPTNLFRAAFWYKNGADIVKAREEFWKKEKSAAYKRGLEDAKKGRRTFTASDVEDKNKTTPHYGDPEEKISFDDLYS